MPRAAAPPSPGADPPGALAGPVLVTGGAGFIGSHLVDALVGQGRRVIVLDDLSTGERSHLAAAEATGRVRWVEGSVLDRELLGDLVRSVPLVFHLAVRCVRTSLERPRVVHEVNARGTFELLEALRARPAPLDRFVYVSSSEVYGSAREVPMGEDHPLAPTTVYGASKLAGEQYARAYHRTYGLPVTVVRPFNTYGPRAHAGGVRGELIPRAAARLLNRRPPVLFGDGGQTRDFTFVADTVEGLLAVAASPSLVGEIVNVGTGRETSVREAVDLLASVLDRSDVPLELGAPRPADVARHCADASKLESHTGFRPHVALREGLERYAGWLRQHEPDPRRLLEGWADRNWGPLESP